MTDFGFDTVSKSIYIMSTSTETQPRCAMFELLNTFALLTNKAFKKAFGYWKLLSDITRNRIILSMLLQPVQNALQNYIYTDI